MRVQMLVTVPLVRDGAQCAIPIVHLVCLVVVKAPFGERLCAQRSQVVDDSLALFPHHQLRYRGRSGQLAAVVQVIVKALIGTRHLDVRFIPLPDHGPQVRFNRQLLAHRRPAADGWLFGHRGHRFVSVAAKQPVAILCRYSEARGFGILAEEVQQPVLVARQVCEWVGLEEGITRVDQHDPRVGIVMLRPDPVPFVPQRRNDSTDARILRLANDVAVLILPTVHVGQMAHLEYVHGAALHSTWTRRDAIRFVAVQRVHVDDQIVLRLEVVQHVVRQKIVIRDRHNHVSIETCLAQCLHEHHVVRQLVPFRVRHDHVLVRTVRADRWFHDHLNGRVGRVHHPCRLWEVRRRLDLDGMHNFKQFRFARFVDLRSP
mmetsp:Transcript_24120/g.67961  ORF Transcript_24120/g.67961 Transcript_24120/m.67961 type:complete len:374 (-) Transcript_24120:157-1278(-)